MDSHLDVPGARTLMAAAAARGVSAGPMYVSVVRPSLRPAATAAAWDSIRADLVEMLPAAGRPGRGRGRAATLSCGSDGVSGIDGTIARDFLEADGWSVRRVVEGDEVSALAEHGAVELAVTVVGRRGDGARFAAACAALGRLADPPAIVLCDFSGRGGARRRAVSGAYAVAYDPEQLLRFAAERMAAPGHRRWGVRLSREGADLRLAPTGRLDALSVTRLADVAGSRLGTFSRLVLDLRELAEIDGEGMRALTRWMELLEEDGHRVALVADARVRALVAGLGAAQSATAALADSERPEPSSAVTAT